MRKLPPPPSLKRKITKGVIFPKTKLRRALSMDVSLRAYIAYIDNPDLSIDDVWRTMRMDPDDDASTMISDLVPKNQLARYSTNHKWNRLRREFWKRVKDRIAIKIEDAAVNSELREIDDLNDTRRRLLENIRGEGGYAPVAAKTLEGAVGALVKLDSRVGDKRVRVAAIASAGAQPTLGVSALPSSSVVVPQIAGPIGDGLTEEDYAAMARASDGSSEPLHLVAAPEEGDDDAADK